MADITMPQLGETVTEGTITRWAKQVGEHISEDEVLFEVSTDKVDSEVPSPASGYVAEILVEEGETVDVGTKLAIISDAPPGEGGDGSQAGAQEDGGMPSPESAAPPEVPVESEDDAVEVATKAQAAGATEEDATAEGMRAEVARGDEDQKQAPPAQGDGQGDGGQKAAPVATSGRDGGGGRLLSPVVRRLISEHDLDVDQIQGTGSGGRITRSDVLSYIDSGGAKAAPSAPSAPAPSPERETVAGPARKVPERETPAMASATKADAPSRDAEQAPPGEREYTIPFSNIRRRTAEHMRHSLDTSTHALVVIDVDFDNVDRVRMAARGRFKSDEGIGLTYMPFIARAVVDALHDFPYVNASVGDNELIVRRYVNLGIAVDLDFEGLIVPVVHDADGKRLRVLAREFADLAARARAKKLSADDISGGTFTITNAGTYGTFMTAPIISQPQVGILATDSIKPRPVAVALPGGGYGVAVHPVGNLGLSFDHRAYDGAYASAFLAKVKEVLETRDWAQELG